MGSILFWAVVIIFGGLLLMFLVNKRAGRKAAEAGKAQVGRFGNWLWKKDPKAVWQQRIDEATEEISDATEAIEENKALVLEAERKVATGKTEVSRLDSRVKNSLRDDPTDTTGKAGEYVTQLTSAKSNLEKNEATLTRLTNLYKANIKKIELARAKIKEAQDRGRQLGVELEMAKTNAKISKLATNFNVNSVNLDGLAEVEDEMRKQIDRANATVEVQTDIGADGLKEMEEEERLRKAEGQTLLEEYKRNMAKEADKTA